jgi:thiol:disulfide interchange protein
MRIILVLGFLALYGLGHLGAQDLPGARKRLSGKPEVKVLSIKAEKTDVAAGEVVKVAFELEIPKGWHIYAAGKKPLFGLATKFTFEGAEIAGAIEEPPLKIVNEKGIGDIDFHEGKITVTVPLKLKADTKPGSVSIPGKIAYQICDPSVCVDNSTAFTFELRLLAGGGDLPLPSLPGAKPEAVAEAKVVSITASKSVVKVGEPFGVTIDLEIPEGWYIYPTTPTTTGIVTKLQLTGAEPAGKAEGPKPKTHPPEGIAPAYEYLDGKFTLKFPMRLKDGPAPGPLDLSGKLIYQICTPKNCALGRTAVSLKLTVKEGKLEVDALPPMPASSEAGKDLAQKYAQAEYDKLGLMGFLLLAVGGGLISLVMPCVFPIVPITITYFVKQGDGSRAKSIFLSLAYSLGIIVAFTGVGFLFSTIIGEADGARRFAANMYVNIVVAGLFLWFAFSLFGLYEITLPSWLVGGVTSQQRKGAGGAFILGCLFSVVTFTCTIPIAGTILAVSASGAAQYRFIGIVAMLVYSATMALPFFLLGLFPSLVSGFRKSAGDWLHTVKVTMGFAELALACFYLSKADNAGGWGVVTRFVMVAIWVAVLIFMILYLLRVFQLKGDEPDPAPAADGAGIPARRQIGLGRMLIALALGVLAVSFSTGFGGGQLGWLNFVLPPAFETAEAGGIRESVHGRFGPAQEEAKKTGKPIFLEFTGASCINCQVMKGTVLSSAPVKALLTNFVFAELYTDRLENPRFKEGDEENRKLLLERYGIPALPAYITLGPDGVERSRILGKVSEAEFIDFLKKGLQAPAGN